MIQQHSIQYTEFRVFISLLLNLLLVPICFAQKAAHEPDSVFIEVDINKKVGPLDPIWAYFGYDEPNYTYMKNGRKLLSEISALSPVPVYVRPHNLLTTGDGEPALKWGATNAYTEDEQGNPVYDWTIVDKIFDTYVERGMKPMVEIGFMPEALSTHPEPYRHHWSPDPNAQGPTAHTVHTGMAYPPKDYEKWAELVYQWVKHSEDRYGKEEVESWWWELWNEPDIGYWQGTEEEYMKLYDYSAQAVKRALPNAKVGGPATTSPRNEHAAKFLRDFLEHCKSGKNYVTGKTGSPLDFITFHAKGRPRVADGHVQMDISVQLQDMAKGFEIVASFAQFKNLPIIISESDPEGCAACSMQFHPQNAYRNGTMYSSYTAASFARAYDLADQYGVNLEGALSWSFEFENQPWFAGFRSMATHGIDKPVLNVFRMFGMMSGNRVEVSSKEAISVEDMLENGVRGDQPDVNALASRDEHSVSVMVWNYDDDDLPAPASDVKITLKGFSDKQVLVHHYSIDQEHSNAYTAWREMGAPQQVTQEQYHHLEESGQLQLLTSPEWLDVSAGKTAVTFSLPRQGVSLLQFTW